MSDASIVKVAVVQAAPVLLDIDGAVEKAIALMDEAGRKGAQLIAFPETWIAGYPWWIWLGIPADTIHFSGEYFANSIEAESVHDQALRDAAKRNHLHAIVGVSERDGGSLYMGQWHYGPEGEVVARRRKLKPTHAERMVFGEGDGSDLVVSDTSLGRIGALCCWEHMQPLVKYAMYSQHEQIHVAAWPAYSLYTDVTYALSAELSLAVNQVYAAEGQCFVLVACSVVSEAIRDRLCDTEEKRKLMKVGGGYSRIFGPDGSSQAEPLSPNEEGLLVADIDLGHISFAKSAADPVGHYARPDVLQLVFNEKAQSVVVQPSEDNPPIAQDVELSSLNNGVDSSKA